MPLLCQCCCDDCHGVDFLSVAASGEVVDWRVQSLKDRAVSIESAQSLRDLVSNVSCVDVREDEYVGLDSLMQSYASAAVMIAMV